MEVITSSTDEQIKSYQEIFKKCFKREVSKQEAIEQGLRLVNFIKLLIEADKQNK